MMSDSTISIIVLAQTMADAMLLSRTRMLTHRRCFFVLAKWDVMYCICHLKGQILFSTSVTLLGLVAPLWEKLCMYCTYYRTTYCICVACTVFDAKKEEMLRNTI